MREQLDVLRTPSDDRETRLKALEQLEFLCELTHNANDLTKLGGLDVVFDHAERADEDIQVMSLGILGICMPNNPVFCDAVMADPSRLERLVELLAQRDSMAVRAKALWALSSLVRNSRPALEAFVTKHDGVQRLRNALTETENMTMVRRAISLLGFLESENMVDAEFQRLLGSELVRLDDLECSELIVNILRDMHDRNARLDSSVIRPALLAVREREQQGVLRDAERDPTVLGAVDHLLDALPQ